MGQCARQFTKLLLSLLSHIGENGLPSIALRPVKSELRSRIHLFDDPEMTFCKDVTGTAFQVFFEMLSLLNCLERDIELDLPRHKLGSMRTFFAIMIGKSLTKVCRMTNVPLTRIAQALDDVRVKHVMSHA